MNEVWRTHQEWLDSRGYDDQCDGNLLIVGREDPTWFVECDECEFYGGLPARDVDPSIRLRLRGDRAGFPARYRGVPFETTRANEPVKNAIRNWLDRFETERLPAPAVYGMNGRGKTHLLVATGEQLIRRYNVFVRFWPLAGLLDRLQDSFQAEDRDSGRRAWREATTCDVLLLDDIGAEQVTEWRSERLARLVDERYQQDRPILVATNFPPRAWEETLGGRTVSRLLGMTFQLELAGDDRHLRKEAA